MPGIQMYQNKKTGIAKIPVFAIINSSTIKQGQFQNLPVVQTRLTWHLYLLW
jgi:hypothetical protein